MKRIVNLSYKGKNSFTSQTCEPCCATTENKERLLNIFFTIFIPGQNRKALFVINTLRTGIRERRKNENYLLLTVYLELT